MSLNTKMIHFEVCDTVFVTTKCDYKYYEFSSKIAGFYIYIEASSPRQENDTAVIKLPPINIAGPLCLAFYYHMYGNHMGSLAVSGRWSGTVGEIWNKTGILSL